MLSRLLLLAAVLVAYATSEPDYSKTQWSDVGVTLPAVGSRVEIGGKITIGWTINPDNLVTETNYGDLYFMLAQGWPLKASVLLFKVSGGITNGDSSVG
jgi:hypothetical protein